MGVIITPIPGSNCCVPSRDYDLTFYMQLCSYIFFYKEEFYSDKKYIKSTVLELLT